MDLNKDVSGFIDGFGLTNLANRLEQETGKSFTPQQINHWKKRGVPYRWQDIFSSLSGIPKSRLKV